MESVLHAVARLQPGDVMLYRPAGFFGRVIAIKTWHRISHVEIYAGASTSVASRDGIGVNAYPYRLSQLAYVLRPKAPVDMAKAMAWFNTVKGLPYGWLDLSAFVGLPFETRGMFCSEFATSFLRAGGIEIFDSEPARDIAPFEFRVADGLSLVWTDGQKD